MKRRREQLTMLTLMGMPPARREPFAGCVITHIVTERTQRNSDQEYEIVTEVTVEGAEYVEAKRLATQATKVVAQTAGRQTVDQPTPEVALEGDTASSEEQDATKAYWTNEAVEQTTD